MPDRIEIPTSQGPAHGHPEGSSVPPWADALLLHGAGASSDTPDLRALARGLAAAGIAAVRVDQPYRVAGRRLPPRAHVLDAVLAEVRAALTARGVLDPARPLIVAGRSSGARVACRAAAGGGVAAVVALGFPLTPPTRPAAGPLRRAELAAAGVPVLVLQGTRDAFGGPADVAGLGLAGVEVHAVAGADHGFTVRRADGRSGPEALAELVDVATGWLTGRFGAESPTRPERSGAGGDDPC